MAFVLFLSLWIILGWYCWLCCRLDRDCSKQQLDVWNSSPDTAALCSSQRGGQRSQPGKKEIFWNYYLKKNNTSLACRLRITDHPISSNGFQTPLETESGNLPNVKPLDLFPIGFTSISAQKVQNPPRRSSRVLHRFRWLCSVRAKRIWPHISLWKTRDHKIGMWCGSWFCLAKPSVLVMLVWKVGTSFTTLCLQESCGLGRKNLPETGLNSAADNAAAVDHGCESDYFLFF